MRLKVECYNYTVKNGKIDKLDTDKNSCRFLIYDENGEVDITREVVEVTQEISWVEPSYTVVYLLNGSVLKFANTIMIAKGFTGDK